MPNKYLSVFEVVNLCLILVFCCKLFYVEIFICFVGSRRSPKMVKRFEKKLLGRENFDFERNLFYLEGRSGQRILEENEISKQCTIQAIKPHQDY